MKKVFVILLMLVYAVSSSGATLHIHYCCGKIDKIDFKARKKDHCPSDNKISQKNCCDNKEVELKIKSDYKAETETKVLLKDLTAYVNILHAAFKASLFVSNNPFHFSDVSPPLSVSVPLYIFDCTYLI